MNKLLHNFFERLEFSFQRELSCYIVKVSQLNGSSYAVARKSRVKILGDSLKNLFHEVKFISERIYNKFTEDSNAFQYNFFPYFKLVRCYGNYQYHF